MREAIKAIKRIPPIILKIHVQATDGIKLNITGIKMNGRININLGNKSNKKTIPIIVPIIPNPEDKQPSVDVVPIGLVYFHFPQYVLL